MQVEWGPVSLVADARWGEARDPAALESAGERCLELLGEIAEHRNLPNLDVRRIKNTVALSAAARTMVEAASAIATPHEVFATPMIAVANIWLFSYTPEIGLLDQITRSFGLPSHNWLGDPDTVLWCIVVLAIWKEAGFFMIFFLAALQSLPPELEEAGRLEGAGRWYYFRRVTFPSGVESTILVEMPSFSTSCLNC